MPAVFRFLVTLCFAVAGFAGIAAAADWREDAPGTSRRIDPGVLPAPDSDLRRAYESNRGRIVKPPADTGPRVPTGFRAELFASGLDQPRVIRVAPNGDVFLAETGAGRILMFRATADGKAPKPTPFVGGLRQPYGIAFYPPGPDPKFIYVAESHRVIRYPYRNGDVQTSTPPQVIVANMPTGGHWTRDLAVAADGSEMFVSIGSASNFGGNMPTMAQKDIAELEAKHGRGAAWGPEEGRAVVRRFDPDGRDVRTHATGLRNCSGLATQPETGALWCVVNERDGLGDDVPPDYATRVLPKSFYGWPWFYIGNHEDPRLAGRRPDLRDDVTVPDVLIQAHSAPLGIAFYDGESFPEEYRGDAFVTLHGSWNRSTRAGYKVVRLRMKDGEPTGGYDDFMTGFVANDVDVWGRPVGIAVAKDGALLVSEDGNGTVWRITYDKK